MLFRSSSLSDASEFECQLTVVRRVVCLTQVSVSLQMSSVRVCLREGTGERVLIEGELTHKINIENSLWSLEPGRCVVVCKQTHLHTHGGKLMCARLNLTDPTRLSLSSPVVSQ